MSLQNFVNQLILELEERERTSVETFANSVPHELASVLKLIHLQGYYKAIVEVKTIMKELLNEESED